MNGAESWFDFLIKGVDYCHYCGSRDLYETASRENLTVERILVRSLAQYFASSRLCCSNCKGIQPRVET